MSEPIRCTSATRPDNPPSGTQVLEVDTGLVQEYTRSHPRSSWRVVSTTDAVRPAAYRALLAAADGLVRELVEFHRPEPSIVHGVRVAWWECKGCDASGYEWEYPEWPCRTSELIAERLGVSLNERHYTVDVLKQHAEPKLDSA